jgi:hypothetical protein
MFTLKASADVPVSGDVKQRHAYQLLLFRGAFHSLPATVAGEAWLVGNLLLLEGKMLGTRILKAHLAVRHIHQQ